MIKRDRWRRWRQWLDVLEEERRHADWKEKLRILLAILWHSFLLAIGYRKRRRSVFRKMRTCFRCRIFDRTMYRCRPTSSSPEGCGCFCPLLAIATDQCWGDLNIPEEKIGWKTSRFGRDIWPAK